MNSFYYDSVLDAFKKPDVGIPPIPPHLEHPIVSTQWGHTYLWAVFFVMAGFSVLFFISSQRASYRYRLMHTTTFFITAIASLSYFAMATGVGKTYTTIGEGHHAPREFFYARCEYTYTEKRSEQGLWHKQHLRESEAVMSQKT